jgi:DNA polymerase III epsilon subunit-like protein
MAERPDEPHHEPHYAGWDAVPRDLRTAAELRARGYVDLGPVAATVADDGGLEELFSTSEARLRRDGMWARRSAAPAGPTGPVSSGGRQDVVRKLASGAAPPPGQAVRGRCERCGREAVGLLAGVCPPCRRTEQDASLRQAAGGWIARLFEDDFVVLDTETTGLGRRDEIIEIAVVDAVGHTLIETLVFPRSGHIPTEATRVHGITLDHLAGAPTWPTVAEPLRDALSGRRVLAWNAPFDERMARQSSRHWRLPHQLPAFECAMRASAMARGVASGKLKLASVGRELELLTDSQTHRSADDARLTLAVLRRLAGLPG